MLESTAFADVTVCKFIEVYVPQNVSKLLLN
jgi:hypothetical protein